jgi:hypothetical protein
MPVAGVVDLPLVRHLAQITGQRAALHRIGIADHRSQFGLFGAQALEGPGQEPGFPIRPTHKRVAGIEPE